MIYPARNRVGQTSAPGVVTTTTETLVGERSALTKQRRGLEAALTRAAEDAERLRQGQRAAADRGNLPDSPHEVRRRALIAAAEVRHATVLDELQRLDARLAQIPGELEALRTPELELERDRQARSRLELSAVELRVAVDIKRLEASLTELASLSKRRQRRSEALILLGRLARKLGSDRAVSLRRFRAPAKPPQAPVNGQTAEVAGSPPVTNGHPPVAGSARTQRRLRRLERDRPALYEQVIAGKLTPGGAFREAGWPV